MKFQLAMTNPPNVFHAPEAVHQARDLTLAQQQAVLRQWKDQLKKLLIADDEGMVRHDLDADTKAGANADCLRRVTDAMARLQTMSQP
jgi:hypothetical protein